MTVLLPHIHTTIKFFKQFGILLKLPLYLKYHVNHDFSITKTVRYQKKLNFYILTIKSFSVTFEKKRMCAILPAIRL